MKILVFSNLPPYVMGGAENQVARLVVAWVESGNDVEVAGYGIPSGITELGIHSIRTHRIKIFQGAGRLGRAFTYVVSTFFLLAKLKKRFDIIYCRGMGDAAISISLAKFMGLIELPLVACPINAKGEGEANFIRKIPGWIWITRLLDRQLNGLNIIAPAIVDDLKGLNITRPALEFIPNGIPIGPPNLSAPSGPVKKLIFTGRLSSQKGLDLLIRALADIHRQGEEFVLDIVGNGPLKSELDALIRSFALERSIHLRGEVPGQEIRNLLIQYDAFVLSSRYEGMSNSVLEAMEAGLAVLTTRCGGIDTYIDQQAGWVCEPDNLTDLTSALRILLKTPPEKLIKMGRRARLLVETKFEINAIAQRNLKMFAKIIASNRMEDKRG